MTKGKIKWYDDIKGFGFIVTDSGDDVFLHRSGLAYSYKTVQPGDNVEFETILRDKGLVARQVSLAY